MSRAWKPGDVRVATVNGERMLVLRGRSIFEHNYYTPGPVAGSNTHVSESRLKDSRPLVVIDPEDAEAVGRLLEIIRPGAMGGLDALAAALREFANPKPRIEEPQSDGALVSCEYDGKVGRAVLLGGSWTFYGDHLRDHGAIFDDFTNVEILAAGWSE